MLASNLATWIELLQERARSQPDKTAFIFLGNGESETASLTYTQLERRSRAIAAYLQSFLEKGDRALLLYPPGLDFIAAFFGCLAAGIMVTHANLLHNQQAIQQAFGHTEQTIVVGWLPLFHDMGLIGNVLQPLYLGIPSILMPPLAFLQRPWRWLEAISHYSNSG